MKFPPSEKKLTILFQAGIVALGIAVLAGMLWEPYVEGRNADSTLLEVYFKDPFLAYAYLASIPFFVGLFQAFKLLGYAGQDELLSPAAASALRTVKHCALITAGAIVVADIFLVISARSTGEDPAGVLALSTVAILASIIVATTGALLERACRIPRTDIATT